jgi:hypothetical protein
MPKRSQAEVEKALPPVEKKVKQDDTEIDIAGFKHVDEVDLGQLFYPYADKVSLEELCKNIIDSCPAYVKEPNDRFLIKSPVLQDMRQAITEEHARTFLYSCFVAMGYDTKDPLATWTKNCKEKGKSWRIDHDIAVQAYSTARRAKNEKSYAEEDKKEREANPSKYAIVDFSKSEQLTEDWQTRIELAIRFSPVSASLPLVYGVLTEWQKIWITDQMPERVSDDARWYAEELLERQPQTWDSLQSYRAACKKHVYESDKDIPKQARTWYIQEHEQNWVSRAICNLMFDNDQFLEDILASGQHLLQMGDPIVDHALRRAQVTVDFYKQRKDDRVQAEREERTDTSTAESHK